MELNYLMYRIELDEREDDIYINSFPKSGTTIMQMILYQLTTDGSMDFDHIDDISPWIRNEAYESRDVKELKSPRILKSHDSYAQFDHLSEGRFIYVYRNPMDVAISKYHQDKNYINSDLQLDDFVKSFLEIKERNWFLFHRDWLLNKKNSHILYIQYEDILNNVDKILPQIINFLGIDPRKVDYKRVKERSGFEFMKKHEDKFGVKPKEEIKVYNDFIRKGKIGEGSKMLSEEQTKLFEEHFKDYIQPLIQIK